MNHQKLLIGSVLIELCFTIIGIKMISDHNTPVTINTSGILYGGNYYIWPNNTKFIAGTSYDVNIVMTSDDPNDSFDICYAYEDSNNSFTCFDTVEYYSDAGIIKITDTTTNMRDWVLKFESYLFTTTSQIDINFSVNVSTIGENFLGMIILFGSIFAMMITGCIKMCN